MQEDARKEGLGKWEIIVMNRHSRLIGVQQRAEVFTESGARRFVCLFLLSHNDG